MTAFPSTGTFLASEGDSEPRTSGDISQCTDRYLIASGRLRAPSASMTLNLAISTRSSLSSHLDPPRVHTDGARKGPRLSAYLNASEFPMAQKKPFGVPGIIFLLGVKYVHFM